MKSYEHQDRERDEPGRRLRGRAAGRSGSRSSGWRRRGQPGLRRDRAGRRGDPPGRHRASGRDRGARAQDGATASRSTRACAQSCRQSSATPSTTCASTRTREAGDARPVGLGARVHDRRGRLLRPRRVQARLAGGQGADRARAGARRPAAGGADHGTDAGLAARRAARASRPSRPPVAPAEPAARRASLFEELESRVREAVERVAASDPEPARSVPRALRLRRAGASARPRGATPPSSTPASHEAGAKLGLSSLERSVLAVCAAPELSPRYGRLYAYLHDDVTRKLASPRLVARLLARDGAAEADVLACFASDAPLRARGAAPAARRRRADSARRAPGEDRRPAGRLPARRSARRARARRTAAAASPVPAYDPGRAGDRRGAARSRSPSRAACRSWSPAPTPPRCSPSRSTGRCRRSTSHQAVERRADARRRARGRARGRGALLRRARAARPGRAGPRRAARSRPAARARSSAPTRARRAVALGDMTALVVEVPLPDARRAARGLGGPDARPRTWTRWPPSSGSRSARSPRPPRWRGWPPARAATAAPSPADLDLGARQASSTRIGELATRLEPAFGWDDLVLPERQREVLGSISSYLRHRDLVLSEWGYDRAVARDQGMKVLFAGESGTGKTMAGQVLARDLGLELFRIDLATIVSKYIGETEKNLDRIFDAADGSNAILFFDEADALFGKRSEVRDSHDRYANIEVAYLLQKMESLRRRGHPRDQLPPEPRRGVPAPARLRDRLPVPGGRGPRADLAAAAARAGPARRGRRRARSSPASSSSRAAASATSRSPRPSWPPRTAARSRCAT